MMIAKVKTQVFRKTGKCPRHSVSKIRTYHSAGNFFFLIKNSRNSDCCTIQIWSFPHHQRIDVVLVPKALESVFFNHKQHRHGNILMHEYREYLLERRSGFVSYLKATWQVPRVIGRPGGRGLGWVWGWMDVMDESDWVPVVVPEPRHELPDDGWLAGVSVAGGMRDPAAWRSQVTCLSPPLIKQTLHPHLNLQEFSVFREELGCKFLRGI